MFTNELMNEMKITGNFNKEISPRDPPIVVHESVQEKL